MNEQGKRPDVIGHLRPPVLEDIRLPGDESRTVQLLSLPLYLAGQLDRLLAEAFGPAGIAANAWKKIMGTDGT